MTALFNQSAKGDPRALATSFGLLQKAEIAKAAHIRKENEFWQSYKDYETTSLAEARAQNKPFPKPLPHPDDIIIDHENGPRFLGPFTEDEQVAVEETIRLRGVLILQDALDRRSEKRLTGETLGEPGGASLLAMMMDRCIPPRLRLSRTQWVMRAMEAQNLTRRFLLKQLYEEWRKLGHPVKRGFVFPDLSLVKAQLESRIAIVNDVRRLPAPEKMPRGEWERAATKMIETHLA